MRAAGSKRRVLSRIQKARELRSKIGDRGSCETAGQAHGAAIAAVIARRAEVLDERKQRNCELISHAVVALGGVGGRQQRGHGIADRVGAQLDARSGSGGGARAYWRIGPVYIGSVGWISRTAGERRGRRAQARNGKPLAISSRVWVRYVASVTVTRGGDRSLKGPLGRRHRRGLLRAISSP